MEKQSDDREISFLIIDTKTGESTQYYDGDRLKVLTKGNQDAIDRNRAWQKRLDDLWSRNGYVKVDHGSFTKTFKEWYVLQKELSTNEIAVMTTIVSLMHTGTNILVKANQKDYYNKGDITRLTPSIRSSTVGYDAINRLIDKQAITFHKNISGDTAYFVNPYLFLNGNYVDKTLLSLFRGYQRRCAP